MNLLSLCRPFVYEVLNLVYSLPYLICRSYFKLDILSNEDTISLIVSKHLSVSRFGDGEFRIIGKGCNGFQNYSKSLAEKLSVILRNPISNHLCCLPLAFVDMSNMQPEAKFFWKRFILSNVSLIKNNISKNYVYGNASFTRFYADFKCHHGLELYIHSLKSLWEGRNILLIEGETSRTGVGNDLLANSNLVRRIICPSQNAYDVYDDIIKIVLKTSESDDLVLVSLGMTATVVAYDLAKLGLQTIDIGHIDLEYCWYKMHSIGKCPVPGRFVNEISSNQSADEIVGSEEYKNQIIYRFS